MRETLKDLRPDLGELKYVFVEVQNGSYKGWYFEIEDYAVDMPDGGIPFDIRVDGRPVSMKYRERAKRDELPLDDLVVYGKFAIFNGPGDFHLQGNFLHISELLNEEGELVVLDSKPDIPQLEDNYMKNKLPKVKYTLWRIKKNIFNK